MLEVIQPGPLTTIQDGGRIGYQRYGVSVTGAMDVQSFQLANLLVGNAIEEAVLELTFSGAKFIFHKHTRIAVTGGDTLLLLNGEPVKCGRPLEVEPGSELHFSKMISGCRAYLALEGGIDVPLLMNSKSTFIRAAIGGFNGRMLKKGDRIPYTEQKTEKLVSSDWHVTTDRWWNKSRIRLLKGPESSFYSEHQLEEFVSTTYSVTPQSDRMGYRLQGAPLYARDTREMISEPVAFGTIQMPSNGQPIVLMADRQTTGGYPRIGQVIRADLCILAQKKPGDSIEFEWVGLEKARDISAAVEQWTQEVKVSIDTRRRQNAK